MKMPRDRVDVEKANERKESSFIDLDDITNDAIKLRELLTKETELLRKMKVKEVGEMHEEKLRLIRRLEINKQLLTKDPSILDGKTDESIKRFRDASDGMDQIVMDNFHEVLKAKEVNQRVIEVVFNKVVYNQTESLGYGRQGTRGVAISGKEVASPSIAINKSI